MARALTWGERTDTDQDFPEGVGGVERGLGGADLLRSQDLADAEVVVALDPTGTAVRGPGDPDPADHHLGALDDTIAQRETIVLSGRRDLEADSRFEIAARGVVLPDLLGAEPGQRWRVGRVDLQGDQLAQLPLGGSLLPFKADLAHLREGPLFDEEEEQQVVLLWFQREAGFDPGLEVPLIDQPAPDELLVASQALVARQSPDIPADQRQVLEEGNPSDPARRFRLEPAADLFKPDPRRPFEADLLQFVNLVEIDGVDHPRDRAAAVEGLAPRLHLGEEVALFLQMFPEAPFAQPREGSAESLRHDREKLAKPLLGEIDRLGLDHLHLGTREGQSARPQASESAGPGGRALGAWCQGGLDAEGESLSAAQLDGEDVLIEPLPRRASTLAVGRQSGEAVGQGVLGQCGLVLLRGEVGRIADIEVARELLSHRQAGRGVGVGPDDRIDLEAAQAEQLFRRPRDEPRGEQRGRRPDAAAQRILAGQRAGLGTPGGDEGEDLVTGERRLRAEGRLERVDLPVQSQQHPVASELGLRDEGQVRTCCARQQVEGGTGDLVALPTKADKSGLALQSPGERGILGGPRDGQQGRSQRIDLLAADRDRVARLQSNVDPGRGQGRAA